MTTTTYQLCDRASAVTDKATAHMQGSCMNRSPEKDMHVSSHEEYVFFCASGAHSHGDYDGVREISADLFEELEGMDATEAIAAFRDMLQFIIDENLEADRQRAKEEAIVLALNLPVPAALSRDGLDVWLIRATGEREFLVRATFYYMLWHDALLALHSR